VKERTHADQKIATTGSLPTLDLSIQTAQVVIIQYASEATQSIASRQIHPRRNPPQIPEGVNVSDATPSPRANIQTVS
jgi:hypothetical protein